MKKMLKYKSDIIGFISLILMILGTILPIVNIEGNEIRFINENGMLIIVCAVIGLILYLFKVGFFSFIPAVGSLVILFIFYNSINDSMQGLNALNQNSAYYDVGFYLIIIGSILLILASIINYFDIKRKAKSENIVENEDIYMETDKTLPQSVAEINEQSDENLKQEFIYCNRCGAIIRKESKKCNFCDNVIF